MKRSSWPIFLYLLPGLAILIIFMWYPTIRGFYLSLFSWRGFGDKHFIGVNNYFKLFTDPTFRFSLWVTVKYMIINVPVQISLAYLLAYLLYQGVRGYKVFRFIFFIPVVLLTVSVGIVFTLFYSEWFGVLKSIVNAFGFDYFDPLAAKDTALYAAMATDWWKWLGIKIVLFYAGFQNLPEDVIQAAIVDGANGRQRFFRLIIPLTWEVIRMVVILLVIGSLKVFNLLFIMTQGGPNHATEVLTINLYNTAFSEMAFGRGSAIAVVLFILVFMITIGLRRLSEREWT